MRAGSQLASRGGAPSGESHRLPVGSGCRSKADTRWWISPLSKCRPPLFPWRVPLSVRLRPHGETGAAEFIVDRPDAEATVVTNADGMTANLETHPARTRVKRTCFAASSCSTSATRSTRTLCVRQRFSSRPKRPPRDGLFTVLPNPDEVAVAAAEAFVEAARRPRRRARPAYVALPGGRTPLPAFQLLAEPAYRDRVPGAGRAVLGRRAGSRTRRPGVELPRRVRRLAPPRPRSPFSPGPPDDGRGSRPRHGRAPLRGRAAAHGSGERGWHPGLRPHLAGHGGDGHTASLCPNDAALAVTDRLVFATWPAGYPTERLTLTYPVLNAAREVVFAVTGWTRRKPSPPFVPVPTSSGARERGEHEVVPGRARCRRIAPPVGRGGDRPPRQPDGVTALLLLAALVAGSIGLAIGLPAWRSWQTRAAADRNAERYLTWRGRGDRSSSSSSQRMTLAERRRIPAGAVLGMIALASLVIGLWAG